VRKKAPAKSSAPVQKPTQSSISDIPR
jgi:hypothetical protein